MRGPAHGDAERGSGWTGGFHFEMSLNETPREMPLSFGLISQPLLPMRAACQEHPSGERRETMIRQAINCDMCGVEKLETASRWFVSDEQGGELRIRVWGAAKSTRKSSKHLCGQKCVQRLVENFTASIVADLHAGKSRDASSSKTETRLETMIQTAPPPVEAPASEALAEEKPILERIGYAPETAARIEAESWAGPVRPKASRWGAIARKSENDSFFNAVRSKTQAARSFQHSA
jgi:hypothetical protein